MNPYLEAIATVGLGSSHPGGFAHTLEILKKMSISPDDVVIEIGCGAGRTACHIAKTYGAHVFALDNSGEILAKARERAHQEVVGKLFLETGLSIGLAESCTGGLIAARLTNVPGCSDYVMGGVVSYSNEMKEEVLGVPGKILDRYGAVSKETAVAMADGIRSLAKTDLGLAVTGIAGPGGGTPAKPVGLVYIALSAPDSTCCREYRFPGERPAVRQGTVNAALNMVRHYLLTT